MRRLGSAALNLSYLAAGRVDAYWSCTCQPWDVAAGVLIVIEAGGIVTNLNGQPFKLTTPIFAAAANSELHRRFLTALSESG
jgi:myo-inositol-1(or 4)-monophosphatase